jgi:hypothetical protein
MASPNNRGEEQGRRIGEKKLPTVGAPPSGL